MRCDPWNWSREAGDPLVKPRYRLSLSSSTRAASSASAAICSPSGRWASTIVEKWLATKSVPCLLGALARSGEGMFHSLAPRSSPGRRAWRSACRSSPHRVVPGVHGSAEVTRPARVDDEQDDGARRVRACACSELGAALRLPEPPRSSARAIVSFPASRSASSPTPLTLGVLVFVVFCCHSFLSPLVVIVSCAPAGATLRRERLPTLARTRALAWPSEAPPLRSGEVRKSSAARPPKGESSNTRRGFRRGGSH